MDFLNDKLTSMTGPALSRVNEYKRRRQAERQRQIELNLANSNGHNSNSNQRIQMEPVAPVAPPPFGGDSHWVLQSQQQPPPPPIGFRTDLIKPTNQRQVSKVDAPQPPQQADTTQRAPSESSLYDTDTWSRLWFQRVLLLSLLRLLLFIRKVYEDYHATKTYSGLPSQFGHFLIASATLFLPTLVFTIYRVSRYLQVALPQLRLTGSPYPQPSRSIAGRREDSHLRQALMSSSTAYPALNQQPTDDDGLVTARQTPTNLDEFQDSWSQQAETEPVPSPAPSTAIVKDSPRDSKQQEKMVEETVQIEKLGNIPDKESVRITIGASEQILHGMLFIFWLLKRQVDVLGYLVERSCLWRKPKETERAELERLRTGSDGLEWFQDFYAPFLAILAQVYTLGRFWTNEPNEAIRSSNANGALGILAKLDAPDLAISSSAKVLSETLRLQATSLDGKDLVIMSELFISSAVIVSLLIAVRRKDDGPLTLALSMLGWGSIFAARIIIVALSFVHIGWRIMVPLLACHVLGITGWIYKISLASFNDEESERGDELRWEQQPETPAPAVELSSRDAPDSVEVNATTSQWSVLEHLTLLSQITILFAVPALFYWPIMFNLKAHLRPFKYLVLILSENFLLMAATWYNISSAQQATPGQWYLLGAVGGFSILGFICVSLYIACKPSLTEYFARADELFNAADRAGIYFEFCSRIFKMPDLSKHAFRRLMNQTEVQEEEEEREIATTD